jgi:hypothetical protein
MVRNRLTADNDGFRCVFFRSVPNTRHPELAGKSSLLS